MVTREMLLLVLTNAGARRTVLYMGKKINLEASDDSCMFQFFKQFVRQTDMLI